VSLEREHEFDSHMQAVRKELASQRMPRKLVPLVDDVWLLEQRTVRERQKFMVLTGRTRCGKSLFALQLRGEAATLTLNCASCRREPDMRRFVHGVHKCVVFEEAHVEMVLACKQLFQATCQPVDMGTSQTQCHAYRVCVHGVLLVVTSNVWMSELAACTDEDREWLTGNSYVLEVTEPLWQQKD